MFSKELRELDRNTVQYMIDVMQDEIDASKKLLEEQGKQLSEKDLQLSEKDMQLSEKDSQLSEKDLQLSEKEQLLRQQALEARLYAKLSADNRLPELGRAVSDEAFRRQLLEKYDLQK